MHFISIQENLAGIILEILEKGAHFAFEGLGFAQKIHGIHAFCFGMGK